MEIIMPPAVILPDAPGHFETIKDLGLKEEWFQEAGMRAVAAHNQTTIYDAVSAGGQYAYLAFVRALRDILCPKGWEPYIQNNLEMVVNPENNISIIVSSGNKDTGNKNGHPKTKNPKGDQTRRVVSFNARQFRLPTMEYRVKDISNNKTWMLLYHIDTKKAQMHLELSLPIKMDLENMRVHGWYQRTILSRIDFEHTPIPPTYRKLPTYRKDQNFVEDFAIELKRKSNG